MLKKQKLARLEHMVKNTFYLLRFVWSVSPQRVLLTFASHLLGFGSWVFSTVIFMRYLFGAAEMTRSFTEVSLFLAFSLALMLGIAAFDAYFSRFVLINNPLLYRKLNRRLFDKATNVDIACYENAEFYNDYTKAASEIFSRAVSTVDSSARAFSAFFSSAYVIITMFKINLWVGLVSLLPVFANLVFGRLGSQQEYEKNMEAIPYNRRLDYVNRAFYLQKYAKEIRLTRAPALLERTYGGAMEGVIGVAMKYWKRLFVINAIKSTICFPLLFEGTWLLGAYLAMVQEAITVSDFVVVANAAVSTTWMLISLTDSLVAIFQNALYTDNLKTFLGHRDAIPEDQPGRPVPRAVDTLELRDVSFRYEGASRDAVRNITMTLRRGELVSVVGHNGSGKSTLVKLIMRLYDPTEGAIYLNGVDIREYELRAYRALIGSTFQDFQLLSMSVTENVLMGNEVEGDRERAALDALKKSGAAERIAALPKGASSTLTREFDDEGINLSSGEAQKVAVARAFAKKSAILLLDEPSSALDPIAEYQLYRNFLALCRGRTGQKKISVFISHRLSSAAVADRVYLMEDGRVTEEGAHDQLMALGGTYYSMFKKQAENYLLEGDGA